MLHSLRRAPFKALGARASLLRLVALQFPSATSSGCVRMAVWPSTSSSAAFSTSSTDGAPPSRNAKEQMERALHKVDDFYKRGFIRLDEVEPLKSKIFKQFEDKKTPLASSSPPPSTSSQAPSTEMGKSSEEFSDLNMDGFENENEIDPNDAQGILGGVSKVDENAMFDDEYSDVLDPRNPPRLDHKHYQMLKGIDWREWALRERIKLQQKGSISSSKANPFLLQMDENETVRMTKDEIMADKYLQMGNDYSVRRHAEEAYKDRILPDVMPPRGANRMTCLFCEKDPTADQARQLTYTNVQLLIAYTNERGMVLPRRINGNCAKHQRKVRQVVMQARECGLLAYTSDWVATADMGQQEELEEEEVEEAFSILSEDELDEDELVPGSSRIDIDGEEEPMDKRLLRLEREKKRRAKMEFVKTEVREETKKGLGTKKREERNALKGETEFDGDIFEESHTEDSDDEPDRDTIGRR